MTEQNWVVAAKRADFKGIAEKFGIDQVTARLIRNRDMVTEEEIREYLYGGLEDLHDPRLMKGVPEAAEMLCSAAAEGARIRVIGDYDMDGVSASYILLNGLQKLGADVDVRIPDRVRDGYGLNRTLVEEAIADERTMILTCDNGIAAAEAIQCARQAGLRVIVTDHHEIPFTVENGEKVFHLPPADVVIDPKQPDCPYPYDGLCGAAVAWKLIQAVFQNAGIPETEAYRYLDIVGMATVGDVMDLCRENRILVREGLKQLHHTGRPGLLELIRQSGLEKEQIDVYHIGFVLGPCLNAGGRLDTALRALQLLCTDSREEAAETAAELVALNARRKELTGQQLEIAVGMVDHTDWQKDRVLVVYLPECHESLAGIIAGRLREKYNRPAYVLTGTGAALKGSGRSIEAYSMYEELNSCRDILEKFGGHPMAAGLTLPAEKREEFRERINAGCSLTEQDMMPKITIDVPMPVSYVSRELVREFEKLRPFGKGNPRPLFAQKDMHVLSARVFGKNRNVLKMQMADPEGRTVDAVYFGEADELLRYAEQKDTLDIVYYPAIDTWQGLEKLQITVQAYR